MVHQYISHVYISCIFIVMISSKHFEDFSDIHDKLRATLYKLHIQHTVEHLFGDAAGVSKITVYHYRWYYVTYK